MAAVAQSRRSTGDGGRQAAELTACIARIEEAARSRSSDNTLKNLRNDDTAVLNTRD